ncbi:MAG: FAD-dependent oxidoreductase [Planctomycetota bacterium]
MELSRCSRRGFLGGALATTLGWLGCGGATAPRGAGITGSIVGGNAARGHLLRGPAAAAPAGRGAERAQVVVCGGGVAGLSAAWALLRHGVEEVVLLELEDALGGTAVSGANAVSAYPWGAHYLPVPERRSRACCTLLEEMGVITGYDAADRALAAEEHLCRAPQERLFYRGHWSEGLWLRDGASARDLEEYDRFYETVDRWAAARDGGDRPFAIPLAHSAPKPEWRELDTLSMAEWMAREGFTSERLRWYVEYATRDDFGCLLADTSAWAGLHYFASRIAAPGGDAAEFLTWPEGNGFLVRHLAGVLGERRRTGAVVTNIAGGPDAATVTYVDAATQSARTITTEQVVCAVPHFIARRLMPELQQAAARFRYAPWVVANCTLDRPAASRGFPLCWDNVLYGHDSLGYVSATHQSDRAEPATVWTWYRPFCAPDVRASRTAILEQPWDHWRDTVVADLRPAHPDIAERIRTIDVWRWGHAMVRPEPGFVWGGAREAAAASRGRVHFAGADLGGLPIFEEAQWTGVRAAEAACTALGVTFESMR